ncbi:MAG: signal recognition particle-docking protein FtsY [Burkholderiales bacterium]
MFSFLKGKDDDAAAPAPSWTERLRAGLGKTRNNLAGLFGARPVDAALLDDLETTLIAADVGVATTTEIMDRLRDRASRSGFADAGALKAALRDTLIARVTPAAVPLEISGHRPYVIMVAGVNGAGKTTSIGKLAYWFKAQGKTVVLAAGDTFRAAAREQLVAWGERNGVTVIAQEKGDAAAVVFDAISAAKARGIDVVLADTAGRLPTQLHLMEEIRKVKRVIAKADPTAPHEVLLVLDGNTGQNALAQVDAFDAALGVTGLVLTKLDGTARGGVVVALAQRSAKAGAAPIPLRFIGVGEGIEDLRPFEAAAYVDALLGNAGEA